MSSQDYLRDAFQALLRGDTTERDRLCKEAEWALKKEEMDQKACAIAKVMAIDFYVSADGTAFETRKMYAASN